MSFQEPTDCYHAIGAALAQAAPSDWESIVAEITLSEQQVNAIVSYVACGGTKVGHLTGVPRLANHFYDLARLLSTEEKGLYKTCKFSLLRTGKYDADFTY